MSELPEAFYLPDGDAWYATGITTGPWSNDLQHAGPPCALLGREVEQLIRGTGLRVVRMLFNIQRPVPVDVLYVEAALEQGGRRVRSAHAELRDASGRTLITAQVLLIRSQHTDLPSRSAPLDSPPPMPETLAEWEFPFFMSEQGYHTGMDVRIAEGEFGSGSSAAWFRMRRPLVVGEDPTVLQRVLIAADSGNGISQCFSPREIGFLNPDLIVLIAREPVGDWVALRAQTLPGVDGIGMAESALFDLQGPIGRSLQSLLIEPHQT